MWFLIVDVVNGYVNLEAIKVRCYGVNAEVGGYTVSLKSEIAVRVKWELEVRGRREILR